MLLDKIERENDIKNLKEEELEELAREIRQFLIEKISRTGGHLASNLGVVELTIAMHRVFHLPEDKMIWDVGHQSYTHKILTGRRAGFDGLRKYGGMSGFPKRKESDCDAFDTGHSSTSISAGLGYVKARDLLGEDYHVISVIGDGAMTGGMGVRGPQQRRADQDEFYHCAQRQPHVHLRECGGHVGLPGQAADSGPLHRAQERRGQTRSTRSRWAGDSIIEQIAGQRTASSSSLCRACF